MTVAKDHLRSFVDRIESLEKDKAEIASDISDVYKEAKSNGLDVKALRAVIKLRKLDEAERKEQAAILETYMHALGMLADTPLGEAAIARKFHADKVTFHVPGKEPLETTVGDIERAAQEMETPAGRKAIKEAASLAEKRAQA